MRLRTAVIMLSVLFVFAAAHAQDPYMELLRSDVRAEKVAIITEAMSFTEEEGDAFWPVYREYELELGKIYDGRLALIKDYAKHYDTMTEEKAKELLDSALNLEAQRTSVRKKYVKKMEKVLNVKQVARFFQIDRQINLLIDFQIASELPLIQ